MSTQSTKPKEKNPNEFILPGRLSFPHIWEPKAIGDGKPRYTLNLLLDPSVPEEKAMILAVKAKANELYAAGTNKKDATVPMKNSCLKKGNDEDGAPLYDGYDKMWYISAARPATGNGGGPPLVIDRNAVTRLKPEDNKPYAGCYVNVKLRLYYQDYDGVKRINASLEVVQFKKNGVPFSNNAVSADDMPVEEGEEEDGLDDSGIDDDDLG